MGEETITVGETSVDPSGRTVTLPVVDVLTGRGFVTGKSGSGKSNSASVVCEKLLDNGYGILIVDIDGEYYGLKEEYEILHVGADDECDLQVGVEHAGKIADLALKQNVPVILDVSSFLDESKARELLTEVTKQLFAKEKKLKQPFLMLVEEIHEYVPEGGGIGECGRMLIKVSKRGRKHGLGIVGISQRPADVKKDFITQCDWLVWHRLTWNNDTKVVSRILGREYADSIEDMADGESFLMTDWDDEIRRVQFERKRTFDAGATPGLDDFERPELKSVSGDLVDELQQITDEQNRRENRIEELERELEQKDERLRDLERQLSDARDLKRMADRFSRAMMEHTTNRPVSVETGRQTELDESASEGPDHDRRAESDPESAQNGGQESSPFPIPDAAQDWAEANSSTDEDSDPESGSETNSERVGDAAETGERDDGRAENDETWDTETRPFEIGSIDSSESPVLEGGSDQSTVTESETGTDDALVDRLRSEIDGLGTVATGMLRRYRSHGPATPEATHEEAGGSGDRARAYAANRTLRQRGFITHVGCGQYDYALSELVSEELRDPFNPTESPNESTVADLVAAIEADTFDGAADGSTSQIAESSETSSENGAAPFEADPLADL